MSINFLQVGTVIDEKKFQLLIKKTMEFKDFRFIAVDPILKYNKQFNYKGFEPDYYIDQYFNKFTESSNYKIIVTRQPINYNNRIYISSDKKTILISIKNYPKEGQIEAAVLQLLYGAILVLEEKFSITCSGNCLLSQKVHSQHCQDFCSICLSGFGANRTLYSNKLEVIKRESQSLLPSHHVILIHGIRTSAASLHRIKEVLKKNGINASLVDYGYFDLMKLIFHFVFLRKIVNKFILEYEKALENNPSQKISVLAHSNGSLVLSKAIQKNDKLSFDAIILSGSIIRRNYDWSSLVNHERVNRVLNDCGDKDIWSLLSKLIPGCGASGIYRFKNNCDSVKSIVHSKTGHSCLLVNENHWYQQWLPFLINEDFHTAASSCMQYPKSITNLDKLVRIFLIPSRCLKLIINLPKKFLSKISQ